MANVVSKTENKIITVQLPRSIDPDWATAFTTLSKSWLATDSILIILDGANLVDIKIQMYRPFVLLSQQLRSAEKHLCTVGLNKTILNQIKTDGVTETFNPVGTIEEGKQKAGLIEKKSGSPKLDVSVINPFISATTRTLEVQARTKSQPMKPYLVKLNEKKSEQPLAIAGIISLQTEKFKGSITIAFPERVFLKIYENMFGEKHEKITNELEDAAGEILNIIYGSAKTELNANHGYDLKPSLPTVMSGDSIKIRQRTNDKILVLPFKTDDGEFLLEIALEAA